MAVTFLEPGGDADFLVGTTNGFWQAAGSMATIANDFVHGNHQKSLKYSPSTLNEARIPSGSFADAGSRFTAYFYFVALPASANNTFFAVTTSAASAIIQLRLTSAGVLQLWRGSGVAQMGSDGSTLSTGVWYRISLAYTITSSTVNEFRVFVNGIQDITASNVASIVTASSLGRIANIGTDTGLNFRSSDHYVDNSSSLVDTGDIWVTAKRPNANGTTNDFSTQIGAGGSGYGSGHSPQVNERPLSTTNGWSMVGVGSAITEEYSVEDRATGNIDLTGFSIVDWLGWVSAGATVGELASIITGGVSSTFQCGTVTRLVTMIAGSSTYPAGGNDVGIISDTTLSTVSLYEAGVLVAYIPSYSLVGNPFTYLTGK